MSYEIDSIYTVPCDCGVGVIEITRRSNDWLQFEEHHDVQCKICKTKREAIKQRRIVLKNEINSLAEARYLLRWLALFDGLNKRQVWVKLFKEQGYPSLQTFYRHVKHETLDGYLRRTFFQDVERALALLNVSDSGIAAALRELASLPDFERTMS